FDALTAENRPVPTHIFSVQQAAPFSHNQGCANSPFHNETKIYRNHRKTPSFSYGDIRWCLRSRQSISSEVRGVTMKPLALAMGRSHAINCSPGVPRGSESTLRIYFFINKILFI